MNYTAGDWEDIYIGQGMYNICLNGNPDDVIAIVDNYEERHNGDDDAQLIAAAPKLYEALKDIIADYEDLDRKQVTQASINKAKKAIARVEAK